MHYRDKNHLTWRCRALALAVLAVLAWPAFATADELWVITADRDLWTIDVSTGSQMLIGTTDVSFFEIAMSPGGLLLGVTSQADLYRIDTNSAAVDLVGPLKLEDPGGWNSMDFDPSGTLYVARQRLVMVNPLTAGATVVGETGFSASGDMAFAPDGALYMAAEGSTDLDDLVRIDPATGAGALVGSIGYSNVYGLDFLGDTLYGATGNGELITIDTDAGTGQFVRNIIGGVFGAATMPTIVPEPGSAVLLAIGLLSGVLIYHARRRKDICGTAGPALPAPPDTP